MKKIALLLAVIMMFAVTALANPSITDLTEALVEAEAVVLQEDGTEVPLAEGKSIEVLEADPERYDLDAVKEAVAAVNGDDTSATVADVAALLADYQPEGELPIDLSEYDFVTSFADLALVDGAEVSFDDNGAVVKVTATLKIDALAGETDLSSYKVLLINPTSGEMAFLDMDQESFVPETGEVTVEFPFLGTFALIQK